MSKYNGKKKLIIDNKKDSYRKLKKYIKKPEKYEVINKIKDSEIDNCIKASNIKDYLKRNEFIYDTICNMLDNKWNKYSPCNFCSNRCIASRNNFMDREFDGCCYSFNRKLFGKVKKEKCIHLNKNKTCDTKNISCKLFTCDYLKKNKLFNTNYEDYLLLRLFFNKKERLIIKYNFFITREEILTKLSQKTRMPYIIYLLSLNFMYKSNKI